MSDFISTQASDHGQETDSVNSLPIEVLRDRKMVTLEVATVIFATCAASYASEALYRTDPGQSTTSAMLQRLVGETGFIGLILFIVWQAKAFRSPPRFRLHWRTDVPVGIGLAIFWLVTWEVSRLARHVPWTPHFRLGRLQPTYVAVVIVTYFVSATYQELLMRWYLISRLEKLLSSSAGALYLSSIMYASWHFYEGQAAVVLTLIHGAASGFVFIRTRSLVPLIAVHTIWNLAVFAGLI